MPFDNTDLNVFSGDFSAIWLESGKYARIGPLSLFLQFFFYKYSLFFLQVEISSRAGQENIGGRGTILLPGVCFKNNFIANYCKFGNFRGGFIFAKLRMSEVS